MHILSLILVPVLQVIFVGTLTSGGLKVSLKDGQLRIEKEGRHRKFVKKVRCNADNRRQSAACLPTCADANDTVCRCSKRPLLLRRAVAALCCMSRSALCSDFGREKALSSWRWLPASM